MLTASRRTDTVNPRRDPPAVLDLTDFKRDLSELTDRLGHAQDCL
jgi:peptide chain release factor 2